MNLPREQIDPFIQRVKTGMFSYEGEAYQKWSTDTYENFLHAKILVFISTILTKLNEIKLVNTEININSPSDCDFSITGDLDGVRKQYFFDVSSLNQYLICPEYLKKISDNFTNVEGERLLDLLRRTEMMDNGRSDNSGSIRTEDEQVINKIREYSLKYRDINQMENCYYGVIKIQDEERFNVQTHGSDVVENSVDRINNLIEHGKCNIIIAGTGFRGPCTGHAVCMKMKGEIEFDRPDLLPFMRG